MHPESVLLASKIAAAYPSAFISDATLEDWAERLDEVETGHANRMASRLRNLPSPPDPWDWRIARRDTAEVEYFKALPPGPVVDDRTPEEKARWEELSARLKEKPVGRVYPKGLDDVPDADLDKPRFVLRRDMVCSGAGQYAVIIDGKPCCPDCKEPLPSSSAGREGNV